MTITIESTNLLTSLNGVRCRIWRGRTSRGVECELAIPLLRVREEADRHDFEAELVGIPGPDECTVVDMRYVF